MRSKIEAELSLHLDPKLVSELVEAHAEAKRNFYLGGLRLSEVEGGRFCEAAFRLLEQATTGSFTPLGKQLDADRLIERLRNQPTSGHSDSIRLHIPRALRLVYDIRNNRDAAHLADGIDPNLQDSTLVIAAIDWILAEFIRLYHQVPAHEAREIVEALVVRTAPIIQDFGDTPRVLNPALTAGDYCLVLLYHKGDRGASLDDLTKWVRPTMRGNLRRTLGRLNDLDLVHIDGDRFLITRLGEVEVESRELLER